jgi:5-methylcytosine-specific restriction enzyme A
VTTLADIKPLEHHRIYDLVKKAGVDVSSWANIKGGKAKARTNPKYCYEWSFLQPGKTVVLNLWHTHLQEDHGLIWRNVNLRDSAVRSEWNPVLKRRALNMDRHIQAAYLEQLPARVVLLDGRIRAREDTSGKPSQAKKRTLDPVKWAITDYDWATGACTVTRGAIPRSPFERTTDEEFAGFEGERLERYVLHRKREQQLRKRKIDETLRLRNGRLVCEVVNCSFDFVARYGDLGRGFAHVHHLKPLSGLPTEGEKVSLRDLAIVCANCHAMIHRHGESRSLEGLIAVAANTRAAPFQPLVPNDENIEAIKAARRGELGRQTAPRI